MSRITRKHNGSSKIPWRREKVTFSNVKVQTPFNLGYQWKFLKFHKSRQMLYILVIEIITAFLIHSCWLPLHKLGPYASQLKNVLE